MVCTVLQRTTFAPGLACIYCYFFPFVVMTNIKNNRIKLATKCNSSVLYYLFSEKVFSYNLLQSIDVYTFSVLEALLLLKHEHNLNFPLLYDFTFLFY